MNINSYPSIFTTGHASVISLFDDEVIIQEKVDGSQISFGVLDGELKIRSKNVEIFIGAPEGLFSLAIENIQKIQHLLTPNWIYRGEYLFRPKHNTLEYSRTPINNIVIFDINNSLENYVSREILEEECKKIGFEPIPELFRGKITSSTDLTNFLEKESFLGNQKIEGIVIKQSIVKYYGSDKKALIAKFVREDFKEVNDISFKQANPGASDILEYLASKYNNEARWKKAAQRLRDSSLLTMTAKDIGPLLKEVPKDIEKECKDEILEHLWKWAWPRISGKITKGLPEWWKQELLNNQFNKNDG